MSEETKIIDKNKNASKTEQIMQMKKKGINSKNDKGCTALIKACEEGLSDLCLYLIREGADVNARDNNGRSPLAIAINKGNYDLAMSLINHGANVSVVINSTLLPAEFFKQNPEFVKFLSPNDLNGGAIVCKDIPIFTSDEATLEAMRTYVEKGGNVNVSNSYGQTFLMMASDIGHLETAKYLIENGADVNIQDKKGNTALMYSSKKGRMEIAELLLENKADINAQNNDKKTAIMMAVEEKHQKVVELLVNHNADITLKDKEGENVLIKAVKNGSLDMAKFFIEKSCEVEEKAAVKQEDSNTDEILSSVEEQKLFTPVEKGGLAYVAKKASLYEFINAQDNSGKTALMYAYETGQTEMFKYLLEKKADISVKDDSGNTILDRVRNENNGIFSKILKESPSRVNYMRARSESFSKTRKEMLGKTEQPISQDVKNKGKVLSNNEHFKYEKIRA